ncbi:PilW family protein [Photobacterium sp. DNB23_23_1]|uniref:Prepilin-type N-terminal cleavage/methylation domain-containing protein n=1 Tax=Photobacterium pectinilyticum TaxID=2906793 RepID=A0ABT1MZS0_9GAMM|nr:prepilin-type N-terminal cleavage/methylation domain-containing protein [Photobacterium sp. ZSDE20]MCQ1057134.1 prepilin-type N-terminal cleavage/methylation domain-containing protein [Photobacterium sp. ZSDE20]MDD1821269.1 prepilin-type N-terminal cleavage/methylation domain-containing protein [Photobacterium sp. ZSDE20]
MLTTKPFSMRKSQGFTLMEMVIALVILGIISLAIGSYLQFGAEGYVSTVSRDRVQSQARFALEKMTREIRHAAPNSLASTGSCISFYPIYYAGFTLGNTRTMSVELVPIIGTAEQWQTISSSDKLALAAGLGNSAEYAEQPFKINRVDAGPDGNGTVLVNVTAPLENRSPANRAYAYGLPVSFCLEANVLRRKFGNSSVVIAEQVSGFDVAVNGKGLENNSMVHINLAFQDGRTGERFSYEHTVQVINVL